MERKDQSGQTILLAAISMFALIAMAALAIDVVTLYVARTEAQRSADAAALAGAKAFVTSGYTSYPSGYANTGALCNGSTGMADLAARGSAQKNLISGVSPDVVTSCDFNVEPHPQITVRVSRNNLPTVGAKVWGIRATAVSATATAEAYNPSGLSPNAGPAIIQAAGVKPFLLPNCPPNDLSSANPNCAGGGAYYVDPSTGNVVNGGAFIGSRLTLVLPQVPGSLTIGNQGGTPASGPPPPSQQYFFPLDINPPLGTPPTPACPASGRPSCSLVGQGIFFDNVACYNPFPLTCGQLVGGSTTVPVDTRVSIGGSSLGQLQSRVDQGTQCLIHAGNTGLGQGQDTFSSVTPGGPTFLIQPGSNNPDPSLAGATNISRSDSVITVPLFDGRNLCAGATNGNPACTYTAPIVGFLQLGIVQDHPTGASAGSLQTIILNASGCNSSLTGSTPVSGGDVSAVPVRLVHPGGG